MRYNRGEVQHFASYNPKKSKFDIATSVKSVFWVHRTFLNSLSTFIAFCILFFSIGIAVEMTVSPDDDIRRYFDANLVIIGEVLACTTKTVEERNSLITSGSDSGAIYHYITEVDIYNVKVDEVLKGAYKDSLIIVQSKKFGGHNSTTKFQGLNEKGESLFVAEAWVFCDMGADRILREGKYIILIKKQDSIYTSILARPCDKYFLNLYKEIQKKLF